MTMDYSPWSEREIWPFLKVAISPKPGNLAVFESSNISKTGKGTPTKIGVHALDTSPYLHIFFEPIPIN